VGIDRFMSEARALTNFAGNAVATLVIGTWTKSVDFAQTRLVLAGGDPFDETTMVDDAHGVEVSDSEVSDSAAGSPVKTTVALAR
jgi:aerobic C4-dicarboxylate transport protein